MITKPKKSVSRQVNLIHDEIGIKIIHLIRYRSSDLAKHEFIFEYKLQSDINSYLVTEKYEGETVLEDYHDHDTVLILCRWLLQLNFELKIYKPGDYPTDKIN